MAKDKKPRRADWIIAGGDKIYAVAHAKATVRGNSTVDADLKKLEERADTSGAFTVTSVTLNIDAWQEAEDGTVFSVIPVTGVTSETLPIICISNDSTQTARQCGMEGRCTTGPGTVTVYAMIAPKDIIHLSVMAMHTQKVERDIEVTAPEAPVIAYYKMPVATAETLGAVKIGANIDVTEDGTISTKSQLGCTHVLSGGPLITDHNHTEECFSDFIATDTEVDDALNRVLGIDEPEEGSD